MLDPVEEDTVSELSDPGQDLEFLDWPRHFIRRVNAEGERLQTGERHKLPDGRDGTLDCKSK